VACSPGAGDAGLDTVAAAAASLHRESRSGLLGRKSGAGFHRYDG
jgi:hypothetical protein